MCPYESPSCEHSHIFSHTHTHPCTRVQVHYFCKQNGNPTAALSCGLWVGVLVADRVYIMAMLSTTRLTWTKFLYLFMLQFLLLEKEGEIVDFIGAIWIKQEKPQKAFSEE